MRHFIDGNRLSRNSGWREATVRDIAKATLIHQRIQTTKARAKEARKLVERLITLGKKDTLPAKRKAFSVLSDHRLVSDLFIKIAPRFKDRMGGYTRIIPLPFNRRGDNAAVVFLELTERYLTEEKKTIPAPGRQAQIAPGKIKPKPEAIPPAEPPEQKQPEEIKKEPPAKSESRPVAPEEKYGPVKSQVKPSQKKIISSFKKIFRKRPSEG